MRFTVPLFFVILILTSCRAKPLQYSNHKPELKEEIDGGWKAITPLETYVGDSLYYLVNGGAGLYHEYGFEKVETRRYLRDKEKLKIEIFHMDSPQAAWGILHFKSPENTISSFNNFPASRMEDFLAIANGKYYMCFYTSNVGDDQHYLDLIAGQFVNESFQLMKPSLLSLFQDYSGELIYIKGKLGLYNYYPFHFKDIFSFNEGLVLINEKSKNFLLVYDDQKNCESSFKTAAQELFNSKKYHDFKALDESISMIDHKNRYLILKHKGKFIYAGLGAEIEKVEQSLKKLMEKTDNKTADF